MNTQQENLDLKKEMLSEDGSDTEVISPTSQKEEIDYLEGWKRCQADFQNYKRDEVKRNKDIISYANSNLIIDLLDAVDIFDLAEQHVPDDILKNNKQWLDGFFYGVKELKKKLQTNGLEKIVADNVEFSPLEHEIIGDSGSGGGTVRQIRAGYRLNGKLLRPAQVSIIT